VLVGVATIEATSVVPDVKAEVPPPTATADEEPLYETTAVSDENVGDENVPFVIVNSAVMVLPLSAVYRTSFPFVPITTVDALFAFVDASRLDTWSRPSEDEPAPFNPPL
jgi:hypothetical protein